MVAAGCPNAVAAVISNKFTNKQIGFNVGLLSFVCKFTAKIKPGIESGEFGVRSLELLKIIHRANTEKLKTEADWTECKIFTPNSKLLTSN